jgi:hypothetical protein
MEKETTLQNYILPFAFFAAVVRILVDTVFKTLDFGPLYYYSTFLICFILEIIFITIVISKYKNKFGSLKTRQALKIGVIIMLITGFGYSSFSFLYDNFIDPEFQNSTIIEITKKYNPQGLEAVKKQILDAKAIGIGKKLLGILTSTLWFVVLGLLISFISGSVLKTKENK